jgi:3-phenylpropionate/trans-cinnamate dioxygenase ferredoxin reductase component
VERVVIVGAGQCGATAVRSLLDFGFGGDISLVNDELESPYERPPLSKDALVADQFTLAPIIDDLFSTGEELPVFTEPGVAAVSLDTTERTVDLSDGSVLAYDRLVLATGAKARALTIVGGEHAFTLRTAGDARHLRSVLRVGVRLVVVGGGFIGLEVAASARMMGCEVTVLEFASQLMGRAVPANVAQTVGDRHRAAGVDVRCSTEVARIDVDSGGSRTVITKDGLRFEADVVVAGVGSMPITALAEMAGLQVDNGIVVDNRLRTSADDVYAAGDCCSFPLSLFGGVHMRLESWRNAVEHGRAVAANLLGADAPFESVPWFWSDQFDLGLQVAGLPSLATHSVIRDRGDGTSIVFGLDTDGRLLSAAGVAPGTKIAKDIRVAERLIAARVHPSEADLADRTRTLKSLFAV